MGRSRKPYKEHEIIYLFQALLDCDQPSIDTDKFEKIYKEWDDVNVSRWGEDFREYRTKQSIFLKLSNLNHLLALYPDKQETYISELDIECLHKIEKNTPEKVQNYRALDILSTGGAQTSSKERHDATSEMDKLRDIYPNAYKRWRTSEQLELIRLFETGKNIKEISQSLGRQFGSIRSRLVQLELIDQDVTDTYDLSCPLCNIPAVSVKGELIACPSCSAKWWKSNAVNRIGNAKEISDLFATKAGLIPNSYVEPHHWVYKIALEPDPKTSFYIGQTGRAPEHRFLQHKLRYKAGKKVVTKRGLALVRVEGPVTGNKSREREKQLIKELKAKGYEVHGK